MREKPYFLVNAVLLLSHGIGHGVENGIDFALLQFPEQGLANCGNTNLDFIGTEVTRSDS